MKKRDVWVSIKNVLGFPGDKTKELLNIIANGNYVQYSFCNKAMIQNKYHKKRLDSFCREDNPDNLLPAALIPCLTWERGGTQENFYKDIGFMLAYMSANKDKILSFLKTKERFEHEYLIGNYEDALTALNDIYNLTGSSFWYIEAKLLILNEINYSDYCDFYLLVRDNCNNDLIREYIRLLKRKVHMRTSQKEFVDFFNKRIRSYRSTDSETLDEEIGTLREEVVREYFEFCSFEYDRMLNDIQKQLLCMALHHLTFIDAFLLIEKLLVFLFATEPNSKSKSLYSTFRDTFICDDDDRGTQYNHLKQLFCEEKFQECAEHCEKLLNIHAQYFEILDIYVKVMLIVEKRPKNRRPLDLIINTLISCYVKKDNSYYAHTYIDVCDRYLRALSSFSSFHELFCIIINTMYPRRNEHRVFYEIKILRRPYYNSEQALIHHDIDTYLKMIRSKLGMLYSCEWGEDFYAAYEDSYEIHTDSIGMKLNIIRKGEPIHFDDEKLSNIERVMYQEKMSIEFIQCIKEERYIDAIHLYMRIYFLDMFLVTKLDVDKLNEQLVESVCTPMLSDMDFFIYAFITNLNQSFPDEPSQCVIDSFAEILIGHQITKPSELIYDGVENNPRYLKFFDLCCNKILEESPCDLYDLDLYEEQRKLLECLYRAKKKQDYQEKLQEVREKYNFFFLGNSHYHGKAIEKINADWITLEYDGDVASAYDALNGYTPNQICEEEKLFKEFKRVLIHCKKEYVRKINAQMGTTIRHSILDTEIVQLLKKFCLFIPECDEYECVETLDTNERILSYDLKNRRKVYNLIQINCLKLFEEIEKIKSYIYFVNSEEGQNKDFVSVYMSTDEIREQLLKCNSFDGEAKFINELKTRLNEIMAIRVYKLRKNFESNLIDAVASYLNNLRQDFEKENLPLVQITQLEENFQKTVNTMGEWFQIAHNSNCIFNLTEYLNDQSQRFSDVKFDYEKVPCLLKLEIINTIDIILINLIRNIDTHAGFIDLKKAEATIIIRVNEVKGAITIKASNQLDKNVDRAYVRRSIEQINRAMDVSTSGNLTLNEPDNVNVGRKDNHGLGLIRICEILQRNYKNPIVVAELDDDTFHIQIVFNFEEAGA